MFVMFVSMKMEMLPDGRPKHVIRQSDLEALWMCPERGRLRYDMPVPKVESSDLVRGNVGHAVIEDLLLKVKAGGEVVYDDVLAATEYHKARLFPEVGVWRQTQERTEAWIQANLEAWFWEVLPRLSPDRVEETFDVLFTDNEYRQVWFNGTPDLIDTHKVIWDWKFPGRDKKNNHEKQKWDIQSHVYCWAQANEDGDWERERQFNRLEIVNGDLNLVTITRDARHWFALEDLVARWVELREAGLSSWPMNWAGWWCSAKWCDHWSVCRGAILGDDKW